MLIPVSVYHDTLVGSNFCHICLVDEGADLAGNDSALHLSNLLLVPPHQQPR